MEFDNEKFEKNVQTSMSTLDKLKTSLKLDGATKGLENVDKAASKVDMSPLSKGVEAVKTKFSAFEVVAITAIANITNSVVNLGKRLVSSLTIDQVTAGWDKYAQKTASVQTIMNATGKSIDEVNQYLDKLMWFSDETSYGFTDMTAALGQLTSAGGDIDKLIPLITGVANATAYAGKGAGEFSRAMYNLNQSYSAGALQYMDWKSLELAGIASKELKQIFIDTAVGMGKIKEGQVTIANFSQTLKDKWADTEVMEKAFGKFGEMTEKAYEMVQAGEVETASEAYAILAEKYDGVSITAAKAAQEAKTFTEAIDATKDAVSSGWMKSFEIIFGNYDEAKVTWTELANTLWEVFASGSEARNEMLQEWKDLGGRDDLIKIFKNLYRSVVEIVTPIKEAFRDIFPPTTAKQLFELTKGIKELIEKFKVTDEVADKIKRTFKGVFALADIGIQVFKGLTNGLKKLLGYIVPVGDGFLDFTANLGDALVEFKDFLKSGDIFNKAFTKIATVLGKIIEKARTFVTDVANAFKEFSNVDLSGVDKFTDKIKLRFEPFTKIFTGIGGILGAVVKLIKKVAPVFFQLASNIGDIFVKLSDKINESVENADFNSIMDIINAIFSGGLILAMRNLFHNAGEFMENFAYIFEGVGDTLQAFQLQIKAKALLTIAAAIGILALSLGLISLIDSNKLAEALGSISVLFTELMMSMGIFSKSATKISGSATKISIVMVTMGIAVLLLAAAMKVLSTIDGNAANKGLASVGALMAMMLIVTKVLSKTSGKMTKGLTGLVVMALAMHILVGVVKKLGSIDANSLTKGVMGLSVLFVELIAFMKLTDSTKMGTFKGLGILLLAAAILVLSSAVKKFSELDTNALFKGLTAVAVVFAEIIGFTKLLGKPKKLVSTAISVTILGAAMLILGKAISNIGNLSWEQIGKGLTGMAGALGLIVLAMRTLPKNIGTKATNLVILSSALLILGNAMSNMGGMSWEQIGKGLTAIAGGLGLMVAVLYALPKSALAGSAAILVMSAALLMFAPALKLLATMSIGDIGLALLALAGVFVIVGVAGYALGGIAPQILMLSAAIALLGVGVAAVGAGAMLFAGALTALAGAGTAAAVAIVAIVSGLIGLIPAFIEAVADGVIAFARVIGEGGPAICSAIKAVLLAIIQALDACIPDLLVCLGKILLGLLNFIDECIPPLLKSLGKLLEGLLEFIVSYVPKIVDAAIRLIIALLDGIAAKLPDIIASAVNLVIEFARGITMSVPKLVDAGFKMMVDFINGLAKAIDDNNELLIDAVDNLMNSVIEAIGQWIEHFVTGGGDLMNGLIEGIKGAAKEVWNTMLGVVEDAWNGVKDFFGIHSPSTVAAEAGMFIDKGLALGLDKFAGTVSDSAEGVGETAMDSLSNAISGISDMVSEDIDSSPTIRPVLDLTDIQNGEKKLSKMLNQGQTISVDSASIKASTISNSMGRDSDTVDSKPNVQQGASFSFTQNNYSPKALSKADIYRQTKNQFSAMKGVLAR